MIIMVIATHPDDEALGCGGVIARHSAGGDEVHVLVVTRGAEELYPQEEIEATRRELQQAHAVLGVKSATFLDFPAPKLDTIPQHKVADAISREITRLKPEVVYFPHRGDIHSDHRVVHQAVLVAARPLPGSPVKKLLAYETLSETEWAPPEPEDAFIPTVFLDVTKTLGKKLDALKCYQSQMKEFPHSRSFKAIEALARFRGSTVGKEAAEAFVLIREIVDLKQ